MWLQGKIKGHQVRIEETLEHWLENLYSNKPRFAKSFSSRFYEVRETGIVSDEEKESIDTRAMREEEYIPIELFVDLNGKDEKINILWNLSQTSINPEQLAKIILDDYNLPASLEQELIVQIMREIDGHKKFIMNYDNLTEEKICTIKLDIKSHGIQVRDSFEWDLLEESNDPVEFAKLLVFELGLPQFFENLISFEIYKQLYYFKKMLNQNDTTFAYDSYIRQKKARGQKETNLNRLKERMRMDTVGEHNCFRSIPQLDEWSPQIYFNS